MDEDKNKQKDSEKQLKQNDIEENRKKILVSIFKKRKKKEKFLTQKRRKKINRIINKLTYQKKFESEEIKLREMIEMKKIMEIEYKKQYEKELLSRRKDIELAEIETQKNFENEMNRIMKEREDTINKINVEKELKIEECKNKFNSIKAKIEEIKNDKQKFLEFLQSFHN